MTELRKGTDLSLRLTRCSAQAIGRNMGALIASQRYLWLSLSRLSDSEKSPLLDAPVSPRRIFGEAVTLMTAKFEADMKLGFLVQLNRPVNAVFARMHRGHSHRREKPVPDPSLLPRRCRHPGVGIGTRSGRLNSLPLSSSSR